MTGCWRAGGQRTAWGAPAAPRPCTASGHLARGALTETFEVDRGALAGATVGLKRLASLGLALKPSGDILLSRPQESHDLDIQSLHPSARVEPRRAAFARVGHQ